MRSLLTLSPVTSGLMRIAVADIPGGKIASVPDWYTSRKFMVAPPSTGMYDTLKLF